MTVTSGSRQVLIHGLVFVLVGLLWGLVVPHTPYPRLALTAHIQFEQNGMLILIQAILLLKLPHRVGTKSMWVMLLSVWLVWPMLLSEVANSWWGTIKLLPIAANQAGAMGGTTWQETTVQLTHYGAGLTMIVAWTLLIIGFVRAPAPAVESR